MKLDAEQKAALDLLQSGENAFLTGSAGTGKSTVTTAFVGSSLRKLTICATTGVAALNLRDSYAAKSGGRELDVRTVYSWAGIGLGPKEGQSNESFYAYWLNNSFPAKASNRIRRAETVVIDEVSMLPGRILNYLDFHCRKIRKDERPFGGIQMVFVGDFLQIPPVNKGGGEYDWAFQNPAWERADIKAAVLTTVHRQDEREFVNLLNDFRVGRISKESVEVMKSRVAMFPDAKIPRIHTRNDAVDKWNRSQLESLPGATQIMTARMIGGNDHQRDWLKKNLITPYDLQLREGARVMVTANLTDYETGETLAVNGTTGVVDTIDLRNEEILVLKDDGKMLSLKRHSWAFDAQDETSASFFQFPLRLAYGMTVYKSQGLTLDCAMIDIRSARAPGEAYVGLSRVRTLAGLHLKDVPGGTYFSPAAVAFHERIAKESKPKPIPVYDY